MWNTGNNTTKLTGAATGQQSWAQPQAGMTQPMAPMGQQQPMAGQQFGQPTVSHN